MLRIWYSTVFYNLGNLTTLGTHEALDVYLLKNSYTMALEVH